MSITSDRLRECIRHLKSNGHVTSPSNFAWKTGLSPESVNDTLNGNGTLDNEAAYAIAQHFPEISAAWLATGEGSMSVADEIWQRIATLLYVEGRPPLRDLHVSGPEAFDVRLATGFAKCLCHLYPQYRMRWLMTGEGTMTRKKQHDDD